MELEFEIVGWVCPLCGVAKSPLVAECHCESLEDPEDECLCEECGGCDEFDDDEFDDDESELGLVVYECSSMAEAYEIAQSLSERGVDLEKCVFVI